jgi:hypothetical protein
MRLRNFSCQKTHKVVIAIAVVLGFLTIGSLPFFSRDRVKNETIEASAMGTGTQLGAVDQPAGSSRHVSGGSNRESPSRGKQFAKQRYRWNVGWQFKD